MHHHAFYSTGAPPLPLPRRGAETFSLDDCLTILHGLAKDAHVILVHPRGAVTGRVTHVEGNRFRVYNKTAYTEFAANEVSIKQRPVGDQYSHAIVARDAQKGGAA